MSMMRIRECYGVPAYRGARIRFQGREGVITGTSRTAMHLRARLSGDKRTVLLHPTWEIEYLPAADQPPKGASDA
jgi:hypothetical protein